MNAGAPHMNRVRVGGGSPTAHHDVAIVGAGAVGLLLGCLLARRGLDVVVLERRETPGERTRAIGIHPPGLRALDAAGVGAAVREASVPIRSGVVLCEGAVLGTMRFHGEPIRSLPQRDTEALLAARLAEVAPSALRRGIRVTGVRDRGTHAEVFVDGDAAIAAAYVVGADGIRSTVREALSIEVRARRGTGEYVMVDTVDASDDGDLARLHFEPAGVVESFPLPGGRRRWVARVRRAPAVLEPRTIATIAAARVGVDLEADAMDRPAAFTARQRLADRFAEGRIALVGDAAHEISPIGGQGMNLGWLDAVHLDRALAAALAGGASAAPHEAFDAYAAARRRAAIRAMRQAAFNMAMGAPITGMRLHARNAAVRVLAVPPMRGALAAAFTMRRL
ncbi:NAD(P)-binding protein [Agromyces sp. CFH 90414]|uniref:NAD(P)-binding protein n=1 Tax=Agromyces agglutinans TaxID=2662258 RepID=A0A6I2F8S0_9MICO|nr:NAD(P)/FAD-dependent oxidoreductase [Agromyces agglutinans]MRG59120.1 NAD(P)-binding protein [Agromyces agglutinans]